VIQLAQTLGGNIAKAFPWNSYLDCLKETMADKWEMLIKQGYWTDSDFTVAEWNRAFQTPSKKFEIANIDLEGVPVAIEGDPADYPLILMPKDSMRLATGYIGSPPFLIKSLDETILKHDDVLVEVHPETADALGVTEGRYAILTTPVGEVKVKVLFFEGIMPGVVALPRGLGHTAYDEYLADKGVSFNRLIGPVEDPLSGLDAAWGIRANLTKA
jgi:anaerobic selenocysteine-containing dehydrogenase